MLFGWRRMLHGRRRMQWRMTVVRGPRPVIHTIRMVPTSVCIHDQIQNVNCNQEEQQQHQLDLDLVQPRVGQHFARLLPLERRGNCERAVASSIEQQNT